MFTLSFLISLAGGILCWCLLPLCNAFGSFLAGSDSAIAAVRGDNEIDGLERDYVLGFLGNKRVDFENVAPKCSKITPVPGGVGPMTVAMLMSNTVAAYMRHI